MINTSNLDPFGYKLVFPNPNEIPSDFRKGDVGFFTHSNDISLIIPIYVSDEFMMQAKQTKAYCFVDDNSPDLQGICLTNNFYYEIQNINYLKAALWHELGHIHTKDLFSDKYCSSQFRKELILNNEVNPSEYTADLFSYYYTSKAEIMSSLDYLVRYRKLALESDSIKKTALSEFRIRKEAIKKIKNEKMLEREIKALCSRVYD